MKMRVKGNLSGGNIYPGMEIFTRRLKPALLLLRELCVERCLALIPNR